MVMNNPARLSLVGFAVAWTVALGWSAAPQAQQQAAPAAAAAPARTETGIPVTDDTVRKACAGCHRPDDKGQLSRISFRRTTPEGWERTITRMMALNGLKIDAATARAVVKSLSNSHGLAPEEARPVNYEVERRTLQDELNKPKDLAGTCDSCHTLGRILYQRRTGQDWGLLINMHRGFYPIIDRQTFRRMGPANRERDAEGRLPDTRHPSERVVEYLGKAQPIETKEWAEWSTSMRPARIGGAWALSGWEPGKGAVFGRVTITPVAGTTDEFTTQITYSYARGGQQVSREGRVTIYTGFQWRGRSTAGGAADSALREVMFVERDWSKIAGRWFTGGYDELGLDITLARIDTGLTVFGVDRTALKAGEANQTLKIHAANAPAGLTAKDLDFGPGMTASAASVAGDVITATVSVAANAATGPRTLVIGSTSVPALVTVYDKVDAIRVTPAWSMARTGGIVFPKQLATFDAWAFNNGPDKKPNTADDLRLDAVTATWSIEEYKATLNDEDTKFVGTIDPASGVFTPNVDGPNPQRIGDRNNIGDVWVVASYTPPGASAPLRARSHLLVAPPLYIKFDPTVTP